MFRQGFVPTSPSSPPIVPSSQPVQASVDLGEINQAAVTTSTGQGLLVTGCGMRTIKRHYNMTLGQLSRLQSRCQKGSKRWRRLQYTRERERGKKERRVRDLWHKGTRKAGGLLPAGGRANPLELSRCAERLSHQPCWSPRGAVTDASGFAWKLISF